jgi:outer membrane protein TolC
MNKSVCLWILLGLVPSLGATDLSLTQALDRALEINHGLRADQARSERLQEDRKEALSRYFPRLTLTGSYTHLDGPIELDLDPLRTLMIGLQTEDKLADLDLKMLLARGKGLTDTEKSAYGERIRSGLNQAIPPLKMQVLDGDLWRSAIELFQPVWLGGKLEALNRSARLAISESGELTAMDREKIREETARLYLLNKLLEAGLALSREAEQGLAAHVQQAETLFNAGLIAQYQLTRARVAGSEALHKRELAGDNLLTARRMLVSLLQLHDSSDLRLTTPLKFMAGESEPGPVCDTIVASSSLLKTIAIKKQLAMVKKQADLAEYLPQVYVFGRYELLRNDLSVLDPKWAVGAGLRLNLFSSGEKVFKMRSDNRLRQEIEEKEAEVTDMLRRAGESLVHQAQAQAHAVAGCEARLEEVDENLKMAESRFSSGLGIALEVIDAHLLREKVKTERLQAIYAYLIIQLQINGLQQSIPSFAKKMEESL